MRKIKFRGKSELTGEWRYGSLLIINDTPYIVEDKDVKEDGHHFYQSSYRSCSVIPETVSQFTGLIDAIGKEIYSGDVIASGNNITHEISYSEEDAGFKGKFRVFEELEIEETRLTQHWINECNKTVIGNIFDNPTLKKL